MKISTKRQRCAQCDAHRVKLYSHGASFRGSCKACIFKRSCETTRNPEDWVWILHTVSEFGVDRLIRHFPSGHRGISGKWCFFPDIIITEEYQLKHIWALWNSLPDEESDTNYVLRAFQ